MVTPRTWVACLAATSAAVFWVGAAPALGDIPYTLTLAPPSSAISGQPFVIQASGTDPIDQGALYLEVDEIPANVVSTCPSGYLAGAQLATSTGGSLVAFDQRDTLDGSGNFATPIGYTPSTTGPLLFCGYTDDGATDTLATAMLSVTVTAPSAPSTTSTTTSPKTNPASSAANAYENALAKCTKLNGKKKTACITRAKLARALTQCKTLAGNAAKAKCKANAHKRYHA